MKHGGVAPQINAVALSNVATRRFVEPGNPVASSVLGFSISLFDNLRPEGLILCPKLYLIGRVKLF